MAVKSHQGPKVDALRSVLSRAKKVAQERPLKALFASQPPRGSLERPKR